MLIFSLTLCGISLNYFQKSTKPWSMGAQLYLIFFNCVPRIMHNTFYFLCEIALHIYLQDQARQLNTGSELLFKISLLEVLGVLEPSMLEMSGFIATPHYAVDFFKYNIFYALNVVYIFYAQSDEWISIMVGFQLFLMLITILNYLRKNLCLRRAHRKVKRAYSMAGGSADDSKNVLVVEDTKVLVLCFHPKKAVLRSYEFKPKEEFVGFIAASRLVVILDKETDNFLVLDACNFQTKQTIKTESQVAYITHATKSLLATFTPIKEDTEGTLIKIINLVTGEVQMSLGLSHSIKKSENLLIFESFLIDIDTSNDKILFNCNYILCSLDIDSKVNEQLCTNYVEGFTLLKANERRVVLSSKEDWVEMYDVPTNQPVAMRDAFLSYSRIIPIRNLHNHYIVEPCCSKKMMYIMRGYEQNMQILTYFNLGFPKVTDAFYVKDTAEVYFVEDKSKTLYRLPFSYGKGQDPFKLQDFEDSIVVLS